MGWWEEYGRFIAMELLKMAVSVVVEVLKELTHRLGHEDLSQKCAECSKCLSEPESVTPKES